MRNTKISKITKFPKPGAGVSQAKVDGLTKGFKNLIDRYLSEENQPLIGGRIIIIGSAAVGKSCLMKRYFEGDFTENYKVTIGVDFGQKTLDIYGITYKLQVFDTAGEERFRSLSEQYYRNADCVLVCFDLTDLKTLAESRKWAREATQYCRNQNLKIFLVGCKSDKLKICDDEDIEAIHETLQAEYWETSALTDRNVDAMFDRACFLVFQRLLKKFYKKKKKHDEIGGGNTSSKKASGKNSGKKSIQAPSSGFKLKEGNSSSNNSAGGCKCG